MVFQFVERKENKLNRDCYIRVERSSNFLVVMEKLVCGFKIDVFNSSRKPRMDVYHLPSWAFIVSGYSSLPQRLRKSLKQPCYSSHSNADPLKRNHHFRCAANKPVNCGQTQLLALPTGVNMEVVQEVSEKPSAKAKPPVVFIHGSRHAAWSFRFFQPYFAEKAFNSYAISWRGNGKSILRQQEGDTTPPKPFSFTVDQCVGDIEALLNHLELPQLPILIGHSLGGYIIQKWALKNPDKYAALVLMTSTPPSGNSDLVRRVFFKRGILNSWRITRAFVTGALSTDLELCRNVLFSSKETDNFDPAIEGDDVLRSYMPLFKNSIGRVDVRTLTPLVKPNNPSSRPVLSVGGSHDVIVDDVAVHELADFWSGDAIIIPDAPHNIMLYSGWRTAADTILNWANINVIKSQ